MITVSDSAIRHIEQQLAKRHHGIGVRIKVKTSGCSGFKYDITYADYIMTEDYALRLETIVVIIDNNSLQYIDGSVLDFITDGIKTELVIKNPNEKDRCGCGLSFSV